MPQLDENQKWPFPAPEHSYDPRRPLSQQAGFIVGGRAGITDDEIRAEHARRLANNQTVMPRCKVEVVQSATLYPDQDRLTRQNVLLELLKSSDYDSAAELVSGAEILVQYIINGKPSA